MLSATLPLSSLKWDKALLLFLLITLFFYKVVVDKVVFVLPFLDR